MYLKTVIKNITKGNLCVASCDYSGIVVSWEVIKVRNGERETGKWKMGTKPNLNPCPISNFIFNFLLCSHFPNSLFPVPKGLSISLCHGERLSPCRRLQVDCWPFWTPPWGPQPCIERESTFPTNEERAHGVQGTTGRVQIQWNLVLNEHPLWRGRMV